MIGREDLEQLIARPEQQGSQVLSVYLQVDQSQASNRNRGFESVWINLLRSLQGKLKAEEKERLTPCSEKVRDFLSSYQPKARALVIFCDAEDGFFWQKETQTPLASSIHWERKPYVRPLLEASDEFERYGVILADRARARLFTVSWGQIEELRETTAEADVRHAKTSGSDHMRSQMQFQRRAQSHAHQHLKEVVETMEQMAQRHHFDRLLLAGPVEATSELLALLSPQLKRKVVATMTLPVDSSRHLVLTRTLRTEEQAERAGEGELVEHLLTSAAEKDRAVVGLAATLESLQEGRIRVLVYAEDVAPPGCRCRGCEMLLDGEAEQ